MPVARSSFESNGRALPGLEQTRMARILARDATTVKLDSIVMVELALEARASRRLR
jgi:hypothetical protein